MNRKERILKYINSSDDFVVNGKRYCENDFYNDIEDLVKENKKYKEVIDKAIEELKKGLHELDTRRREEVYVEEYIEESIDILEEVR